MAVEQILAMMAARSAELARESATNTAIESWELSGAVRIPTSLVAAVRPSREPLVPVLWAIFQPGAIPAFRRSGNVLQSFMAFSTYSVEVLESRFPWANLSKKDAIPP